MTTDSTVIFGISDGPFASTYTFVDVLAVVEDHRIISAVDLRKMFPDRGTVFLAREFWIPPRGVGAIWRVARQPPDSSHSAEFAVVASGRKGPLEIVRLLENSGEPRAIREALFKGINLPYAPYGEVLFELTDGKVIGPVRADHSREANFNGFFCGEDAFLDPLNSWESAETLKPIEVVHRGCRRRFTSFLQLPRNAGLLDVSDFEARSKQVFRFAAESSVGLGLTRRDIERLGKLLSKRELPQRVVTRADEVLKAVRAGVLAKERVALLARELAEIEPLKTELDGIRETVRAEEIARMSRLEATTRDRIRGLVEEEDRLESEVEARRVAIEKAGEEAATVVGSRIREVQENATKLLADIVVLKPFLSLGQTGVRATGDLQPLTLGVDERAPTTTSLKATLRTLAGSLHRVGIASVEASAVACEVLAAALAGQITTFAGSLADPLARECAICLGGGRTTQVRIPFGVTESDELRDVLRQAHQTATDSKAVVTVFLQGMNRSAIEGYGEALRDAVTEGILEGSSPLYSVICLGSTIDGMSTLPLTPLYSELGPVLETDALRLTTPTEQRREYCRVQLAQWQSRSRDVATMPDPEPQSVGEILALFKGERSVVWEAVATSALRALQATHQRLEEGRLSTAIHSLLFGWAVPHAKLGQVFEPEIADRWRELAEDLGDDVRLERLLELK